MIVPSRVRTLARVQQSSPSPAVSESLCLSLRLSRLPAAAALAALRPGHHWPGHHDPPGRRRSRRPAAAAAPGAGPASLSVRLRHELNSRGGAHRRHPRMPRRRWLRAALIVLCCLGAAPPGLSGLGGDAQAPAGEEGALRCVSLWKAASRCPPWRVARGAC